MSDSPHSHPGNPPEHPPAHGPAVPGDPVPDRRGFMGAASSLALAGGLVAGYGTLAYMAGRFLYPSKPLPKAWVFVAEAARLKVGDAVRAKTPAGQTVTLARRGEGSEPADFLALSSTCPHLGCQVHWEAQNNRFFCPCHNGVFDPEGKAVQGPPAEAKQSLPTYPIRVENGLVFIEVPV